MNILLIKHFFVGFMVSEIPRVSVFGHCSYSVTFPYCRNVVVCDLNNLLLIITYYYILVTGSNLL